MSNNRSAELEKLFDEWRKRHISEDYSNDKISKNKISKNNFIPDGIIDEASYMQSPKKILFIAKEAACLDKTEKTTAEENFETAQNDGFWCRRVVLGEEKRGTSFSSGLALLANAILNENFETPEKDISALRYVAFMNINKRGGFTSCPGLDAYVKKYKDLIDREIRIISPDIIVCCGIGVRDCLSGVDFCKSLPVLEVYHPSARYKTDTDRLKKLEDELKNAQF